MGGVRHGLRHRVVWPLMLAAAVANTFMMFGFYSWQRYFLDLLGKELVWVNGVVAALVGLASSSATWRWAGPRGSSARGPAC